MGSSDSDAPVDATSYAGQPFPRPMRPSDIASGARVYCDRFAMTADLMDGVMAEVGVLYGHFSRHLLACEPEELHLFDRNVDRIAPTVTGDARVRVHRGDSAVQLRYIPDGYFDSVYIDGDHSMSGVADDAAVVKRKLKPGGLVIFNDYTLWSVIEGAPYGVCHAVADLCAEGFRVVGFALQFQGYHDIALVAP